ncbi:hypothetical protein SAMN04488505_10195 [Chitinophaga rupis]|uniref:Uncharacterized protein n=1 Tax=Chitinophaga rupis TaxID=573321 RepID=A0A1H7GPE9_9BACT|nr:hypothetical protein [Chitinophaga rupis]SEK38460.1 hypothetical protein SAMN04488505_10195 [Chitinophaga rupis]
MKKNRICLLAVLLAVTAASYTHAGKLVKKPVTTQWFLYSDGGDDIAFNVGEARNAGNYIEAGTDVSDVCNGTVNLCAVLAQTNNHLPVITQGSTLDNQLVTYFNTGGTSVGGFLKEKP